MKSKYVSNLVFCAQERRGRPGEVQSCTDIDIPNKVTSGCHTILHVGYTLQSVLGSAETGLSRYRYKLYIIIYIHPRDKHRIFSADQIRPIPVCWWGCPDGYNRFCSDGGSFKTFNIQNQTQLTKLGPVRFQGPCTWNKVPYRDRHHSTSSTFKYLLKSFFKHHTPLYCRPASNT